MIVFIFFWLMFLIFRFNGTLNVLRGDSLFIRDIIIVKFIQTWQTFYYYFTIIHSLCNLKSVLEHKDYHEAKVLLDSVIFLNI
jgi:hypothetical protein